ncbi:CDP-diacylglycerol--serine O-phosphatidyltransferase [Sphingomonas jejuensis]|uniref:CDP-diacylglycerol--serine O-phosphatidyltransferase n=1 Tax=Sphingomonas jejuensis TaxID=904715 RepID=A0ABX0XL08_9SPHN|nr:CDP-diacylglycerol--serine O-phosphatidyltransferase [Sphingomonas jejuensis]
MLNPEERQARRGITLRALAPNTVTALALCTGLTGVRFAIGEDWERAAAAIILAGVLDGLDGRIARLLKGESRFGAELDSLSDVIAFGVAPALILFLWSLQAVPQFGWIFALAHAVCCALRLARFNAAIDDKQQPHKSAGFLTGVPAPSGAGLTFLPLFLWLWTGEPIFREPLVVAPWAALVAFLMISNVATYSWSSLRVRRTIRLEAIAVVAILGGALLTAPWATLSILCLFYLAAIPFSIRSYARVQRQRRTATVA